MVISAEKPASVRVSQSASAKLEQLAKDTGKTKVALVDEALAALEDRLFWAGMDAGYAKHGEAIRADLAGTEGSLSDGLGDVPA